MALYVFCMGAAYTMGLFKRFVEWREISRVTLLAGPLLIGVGLYFSTQPSSSIYWMLVPVWIYIGLVMVGGFALRRLGKADRPAAPTPNDNRIYEVRSWLRTP
jgi:hypothetical protein